MYRAAGNGIVSLRRESNNLKFMNKTSTPRLKAYHSLLKLIRTQTKQKAYCISLNDISLSVSPGLIFSSQFHAWTLDPSASHQVCAVSEFNLHSSRESA
jgi:hypothetical protein